MSDGPAMLACSDYFLPRLQPHFTGPSKAKDIGRGLAASSIREISVGGTSV